MSTGGGASGAQAGAGEAPGPKTTQCITMHNLFFCIILHNGFLSVLKLQWDCASHYVCLEVLLQCKMPSDFYGPVLIYNILNYCPVASLLAGQQIFAIFLLHIIIANLHKIWLSQTILQRLWLHWWWCRKGRSVQGSVLWSIQPSTQQAASDQEDKPQQKLSLHEDPD